MSCTDALMFKQGLLAALCFCIAACQKQAPVEAPQTIIDLPANAEQAGALSGGEKLPVPSKADVLKGNDWPKAEVASGDAFISCQLELTDEGDGEALVDLSYKSVAAALGPCEETDTVRLRYRGKIATDFTALVERVANIAERLHIETRVIDLDSSGGHVEDAMKAGDAIGASRWTLWVRENAICHSACVLILAAGDDRQISGKVGIHRMIRVASTATTRAELSQELREVYAQMKEYLERNGAAVTVADLMMTVPNRKLRLLAKAELEEYGLEGTNAVQDDLERISLTRKCGEDFVIRKDEFTRSFERECNLPDKTPQEIDACGLELREGFGFPDEKCPIESPLSALDVKRARGAGQAGTE
jgi:membrane-bound ClpP family serine protease